MPTRMERARKLRQATTGVGPTILYTHVIMKQRYTIHLYTVPFSSAGESSYSCLLTIHV